MLDEPTSSIDFGNQIKILKTLKNLAKLWYSAIITTRNPSHAFDLNAKTMLIFGESEYGIGDANSAITTNNLTKAYKEQIIVQDIQRGGKNFKVCLTNFDKFKGDKMLKK
ncbi:MAG: hypothetical protein MR902_07770 [Campylobacter sp.]|nr:hypothetical protein [Campylobacter sp.]